MLNDPEFPVLIPASLPKAGEIPWTATVALKEAIPIEGTGVSEVRPRPSKSMSVADAVVLLANSENKNTIASTHFTFMLSLLFSKSSP
jgi:hypothetical protein